jgi:hypothetical protein
MHADSVSSLCGSFQRSRRFVVKNIENNIQARKNLFGSSIAPGQCDDAGKDVERGGIRFAKNTLAKWPLIILAPPSPHRTT